jgi:HD-GYP domain-containing protein (c-di-GMP phosphodiesterase class II)
MNEASIRDFLQALKRVTRQVGLYPPGHPLTAEALVAAEDSVRQLTSTESEVVITLAEDAFYLNRVLLPHTSLEYNGLLRSMQARGIETITVISPVSGGDLFDLAAFIAAVSDDLPADGTIRLNESGLSLFDQGRSPLSRLRRSYVGSLDTLRVVNDSMAAEGAFELNSVVEAVEGLLESSLDQSGAALLLSTVKSHDEYTFYHSVNVCILSLALGRLVGLADDDLVPIGVGAALHDIGKVAVPTSTLNYPGRLSVEQWQEVELHPQEGSQAILAAGGTAGRVAAVIALEHHSRFDGMGYPVVTRNRRPHPFSRLVSVVDTYDAITTRRVYRRAETPNRALNALLDGAGSAYDPDMVRLFIEMMGVYPPGSVLRMSNGETIMVVGMDGGEMQAVMVRDREGVPLEEPEPVSVVEDDVVDQLPASQAGIDPASVLEHLAHRQDQVESDVPA